MSIMASPGGAFPIKFKAVEDEEKEKEMEVLKIQDVKWDPFSSTDWDNQKPSSEAIVRIKR